MKFLVIGTGSIGSRHIHNLLEMGYGNIEVLRSSKKPSPYKLPDNLRVHYDLKSALDSKPDAAVIATPSSLHVETALKLAESGCPFYIEKPISDTMDHLDKLKENIEKTQIPVQVGLQFRFNRCLLKIKEWLHNRALGEIFYVNVNMGEYLPSWHPHEDYTKSYAARKDLGGGVILSQIHDIDYLAWLFKDIDQVYAIGGKCTPLQVDVEDNLNVLMRYKEKYPISLHMDYWQNPPERNMVVIGEGGKIYWDYYKGNAVLQTENMEETFHCDLERNEMFKDTLNNFICAVREKKEPLIPLSQGLKSHRLAMAIKTSIERNTLINIPDNSLV